MVKDALVEAGLYDKCYIKGLADLTTESDNSLEWGFYLYANIVNFTGDTCFTMYYSDGFEIITKWFPGFLLKDFVSLSLLARGTVESGVSATSVRNMIIHDKDDELQKNVPECIYKEKKLIKAFLSLY